MLDPSVRAKVRHILEVELEDTVRARIMKMDESGQYERIDKRGKVLVDSQEVFCNEAEEQALGKMKVYSSKHRSMYSYVRLSIDRCTATTSEHRRVQLRTSEHDRCTATYV